MASLIGQCLKIDWLVGLVTLQKDVLTALIDVFNGFNGLGFDEWV